MRIRKRWPPPPPPPSPPPSHPPPLPSCLPPLKPFAPDLPTSRLQQLSSSESQQALHYHTDLSTEHNFTFLPHWDSQNQQLQQSKINDLPRSNLQLAIIRGENGWICSNNEKNVEKVEEKKKMKLKKGDCMHQNPTQIEESGVGTEEEEEEEAGSKEKKLAASNRRNNFGAETSVGASNSSSSSQRVGRWGEGEKVFPLKKRRESFEQKVNKEMIMEKEKKTKAKMKTKTNKKWVHAEEEDDEEEEENQERADGQPISASGLKKRGSGGTNMEGSRCSRVNGRGWRCCQQTLVGYSLCEHHLGKGRLRSMSSVRNRASAAITKSKKEEEVLQLSSLQSQKSLEFDEDEEEEEEDEKPLMIKKKRKKIGMVKARSISSLLGLTQTHAISATTPQPPADDNHSSTSKVHDMKL